MHRRQLSVETVCRHLMGSGFPFLACVIANVIKRGLGGACQKALLHCGAMALPTSWAQHRLSFQGCPTPYDGSVSYSHGPHLSRLTACKGIHDVQCATSTSFLGAGFDDPLTGAGCHHMVVQEDNRG